MKTDTEYFRLAVEAYCKAHKYDAMCPISMVQLLTVLRDMQTLKDADKARLTSDAT